MNTNTYKVSDKDLGFVQEYKKQNPTANYNLTGNVITSPVSYLSSENAANNVNESMIKINGQYPVVDNTKTKEVKNVENKDKAFYTNDSGQEAEFTSEQLKDKKTQQFLKDNGYVQTKTTFPTSEIEGEVNELDSQIEDLSKDFMSYNVLNDPQYQAQATEISNKYAKLQDQMKRTNAARESAVRTLGIRGGTTEFAGGVQMGIEGEELNQANSRIAELESAEISALSALRSAYEEGKWNEYSRKISSLENIRERKSKELESYNTKMADILKNLKETEIQSTRDTTIANLMNQGVTDPVTMLDYLNFDEKGNRVGDFTAKEVADTLKNLSSSAGLTIDKLTGEAKNYFVLKDIPGALPSSITSLPKEQQLGSYLKWQKDMTTSKTAQDAGYGSGKEGFNKFSAENLALINIPATLRNSEVELERFLKGINLGLDQGMTPYEVADSLMGYTISNPDKFSDNMRTMMVLADLPSNGISGMSRLINSGNKQAAVALVENKILENQKI